MRHRTSIAIVLGSVLVFGSLILPVKVVSPAEREAIEFGLPFRFFVQDQSRYDPPPESFPRRFRLVSPLEAPTQIRWNLLGASLLTTIIAIAAAMTIVARIFAARRKAYG